MAGYMIGIDEMTPTAIIWSNGKLRDGGCECSASPVKLCRPVKLEAIERSILPQKALICWREGSPKFLNATKGLTIFIRQTLTYTMAVLENEAASGVAPLDQEQ
jgi:hypothetical protein